MMMKKEVCLQWLYAAGVRALKTMSQTAIASIGTSVLIEEVYWIGVISTTVLAGILSMLMSITGLPEVDTRGKGI